jgi:TIR domain
MTDFFVSYTATDRAWAEWIAFVLEEEGYSVTLQAWDFRPGENFALRMQEAASEANRTIAVVSPDYFNSAFARTEWAAAFAGDPTGKANSLVPVIVRSCELQGLLKSIIHVDLSDADEASARSLLIHGLDRGRVKPTQRPMFPGSVPRTHVSFPGRSEGEYSHSESLDGLPELRRPPTDFERRQFTKLAFDLTQARFRAALVEMSRRNGLLTYEIEDEGSSKFSVDAFYAGRHAVGCSVRKGSLSSPDGLSYVEGMHSRATNAANEILTLANDGLSICFCALVGDGFSGAKSNLDLKRLSAKGAATYLWSKFASALEYSVGRQ